MGTGCLLREGSEVVRHDLISLSSRGPLRRVLSVVGASYESPGVEPWVTRLGGHLLDMELCVEM